MYDVFIRVGGRPFHDVFWPYYTGSSVGDRYFFTAYFGLIILFLVEETGPFPRRILAKLYWFWCRRPVFFKAHFGLTILFVV